MRISRLLATVAVVVVASVGLSACASASGGGSSTPSSSSTPIGGNVITPLTKSAGDLQGATVDLVVGQVLNIDTGDLATDSYTGEVADPKVAEFVQGTTGGSATTNPGVTALATGTTQVTMTNANGGIQPLRFTVVVTAK